MSAGGLTADHGSDLSPADEALLRGPPPARAIAWCERAAGARTVAVSPLRGGTSSAVHALTFAGGRELVLRRFVRTDWLAEEPDAPAREVAALEIAERCAVPTPRLVAADQEGAEAGDPAVLTTRLPGAVVWRPPAVEPFLEGLAALLPAIHDTPAAPGDLPAYAPYRLETDEPPPAARDRGVWQAAFALCAAEPPPAPAVFLHRDFHPGNVLWADGRGHGARRLGERGDRTRGGGRRPLPLEPRPDARAGRRGPLPRPLRPPVPPILGRRRGTRRLRRRGARREAAGRGGVPGRRGEAGVTGHPRQPLAADATL